ncbi:MAG: hypothetical protein OEW58_05970 [Gammaproteobacteria bacterium]|nr:hypothetical protein [Gammaproteobacteria bacterium]
MMQLTWQSTQTLANGASVLRFNTATDTLWQPGDRLRFAGCDWALPVMRSAARWVECLSRQAVPPSLSSNLPQAVELLAAQRWQQPTTGAVLVLADEAGMATAIHAAQCWFHGQRQALVLLQLSAATPFSLRPSQFMVQGLPPGVIAAAPLLEDWGIASRIASEDDLPGCFSGSVLGLAQHWLGNQRGDVHVLAAGGEELRTALEGIGEWQYSHQD